ncbi:ABC transporter permease [Aminobacter sp. LjRoot7]|uniref:ABC transporter permease n=1 Tax=Aminobacter sp. LjRoot7 TaxID=3342335 RepID=UPI003ECD4A63
MSALALTRSCRKRMFKMPDFRQVFLGLVIALALLIVGLIFYPILLTLVSTFVRNGALTGAPFEEAVAARGFSTILYNTLIYTTGSLFLSCAIGIFLAWANERTDARMDSLAGILPILPLMVPPIGSALGYVMLFANNSGIGNITLRYVFGIETGGPVSILNFYGLIAVSSLSLAPVVYLIVSAALRNMDPALDEAARVFGASPRKTLWKVTLPVVGPAIASAALLVGIHAVSSFTFPFIIGTGAGITTLSVHIYRLFAIFPPDPDSAVAVSLALLLLVYLGLFFQLRVARAVGRAVIGGKSSSTATVKLGPWRYVVRALFIVYLGAVILPVVGLAIGSLQPYLGAGPSQFSLDNFRTVLGNFETRDALINSFSLGALAATINMAVAGILMFASMRMLKKSGHLIEYSLMVPAVIPHIVLAVALIIAFSGPPFYLYGTKLLVLIAYCVMFIPEASRAASSAISQASEELSEAAHVAGAGLFRTLRKVVLPQVVNGLLAGWVIVFFLAVNEVTASSFLGGLNSAVVGHVAIDYFANGRLSEVAAMTLIVTVVTAAVVLAASGIIGRAYASRR